MYQRDDHRFDMCRGGNAIAWPAALARAGQTIVRHVDWRTRLDPVIDLGDHIGSARWCRGVVTLIAMVVALVYVAPGLRVVAPVDRATKIAHPVAPTRTAVLQRPQFTPVTSVAPVDRPAPLNRPPTGDATVRLSGTVGASLYTTLRAAGAAPSVAADYIRAVAPRIDIGEIAPADHYDIVVAHTSGAIGAARDGRLLYAGIVHDGQPLSLLRWTLDGHEQWLDAAGAGAPSGGFTVPVADARLSSGFGMRFHPILGFSRMHQGVDLAAPLGTPIVSAAEGIVRFAGAHGGYGNFVQVQHGDGMGTGYGHMSGIVVRPGDVVRQGELLGYVGSTGLSTGPHCHFEVYRNGVAIDPLTAQFAAASQLSGAALGRFRATLAKLTALPS